MSPWTFANVRIEYRLTGYPLMWVPNVAIYFDSADDALTYADELDWPDLIEVRTVPASDAVTNRRYEEQGA